LVDFAKYDSLIQDLTLIESEIAAIVEKLRVSTQREQELEIQLAKAKQENAVLIKRISELEHQLENTQIKSENEYFGSLNTKEKEVLKQKIQNLITRIEYHLSS
jgi:septal ring factor EnvC (AmiA/AmiB activator)